MEIWTRRSPTPARMITSKNRFPPAYWSRGSKRICCSTAGSNRSRPASAIVEAGPLRIDTEAHTAAVRGEQLTLTNKEYELLLFLARHPNQVFSREDLYELIWGLESMGDNITVAVHVNRLREKVEENPSKPQRIQTVWGVGYRLNTL